jgi:RNA polymerase sigma-70 factor (ECF subfamily)
MPSTSPPDSPSQLDSESRAWLQSLGSTGHAREEAVARLHALLLRAARFEAGRRRSMLAHWDGDDIDDLAAQAADDALVAVLSKLDEFRGHSRFTTWAYKFALLETAVKLRRRPWQGRELPLEPEHWAYVANLEESPAANAEQSELLAAVRHAIDEALTPHQREILIAVALNGVPIDVLAERLGTTRGALYKTIHDARQKLRQRLRDEGHMLESTSPKEGPR